MSEPCKRCGGVRYQPNDDCTCWCHQGKSNHARVNRDPEQRIPAKWKRYGG